MNGGSDTRVEQLFAAAVERPVAVRSAFVADQAETAEIRLEVLSLLEAHDQRGRFDSIGDWLRGANLRSGSISFADLRARISANLAGRYRIDREIARGGMAIVLLADDLKHGRAVALKVLRPGLTLGIGPDRFLHEIAVAAKLTHPHILPLHDSGEADGLLYYVMPFIAGESLRERLRRERRLPLADALQIMREVADALSHAHEQGVIHRDIKPDNIMLQAGHAIVGDFGIARAMSAAASETHGESGIPLGTPPYMSPEQARAEQDVDGRSDVYSMACILFEMLAGRPPFTGSSAAEFLKKHARDPPPAVRRIARNVPAAVDAAIQRALSKTPSDRFTTAAEFAAALMAAASPLPAVRRSSVTTGAIVVSATAIGTIIVATQAGSPVPGAAPVMAVLPLAAAAVDTGLVRLGRDLVVTLSANLDGVGEIRTIDALTVLAQTRDSGALPVEEGAALARRLGASTVALGTIVRIDPQVRVDLGLFTADSIRPLARGSVTADPDDLPALTDSLTWLLLRGVWRARAPPTPNVAAVTTQSLPALRAFLEGERAGLEGRWEAAADAFSRAMRADSTFWLAYWRYSYARWWYLEAVDDSVLAPLYENRFALPERDRLVLESWWTDTIPVALARAREAVERYPDYWPGWMQYADWLFHVGPVHGYERKDAQAALESVVALNRSFLPAWEHLYWATVGSDAATAARALDAMIRLGYGRSTEAEYGFDITQIYRLELQIARGTGMDVALLDRVARDLAESAHARVGGGATLPRLQAEISDRVLRAAPRPPLAAIHEKLLAESRAARGAWAMAIDAAEHYVGRVGTDPLDALRYAVLAAWLGAMPPDSADRLRTTAARAVDRAGTSAMSRAELGWLDGLLAFTKADRIGLAAARASVRAAAAATSELLDSSLASLDRGLRGDRLGAATALAQLNWENPDVLAPGYGAHPYLIAVSRFTAARWFREAGQPADAVRPLMWFDAWWALDGYRSARRVLTGLASLERARIATLQGDRALARQRYEEFLRRYDAAPPAQIELIDEARDSLS